MNTLQRALKLGVEGLKLHPLHMLKNTLLAFQWRKGEYQALSQRAYIDQVYDLIELTPAEIALHRLTGYPASADLLLEPAWCEKKWDVLEVMTNQAARFSCHCKTHP